MDPVRPDVRSLTRAGRDGSLHLAFERRGPRTVLTERRFRTPLQVLEPLAFTGDPAAGVMLLNPTGGVLGGDHLTADFHLGPDTHVVVATPSATRVYGSRVDAAVSETVAHVGRGATLEYVPDHVIPHPNARFTQSLSVEMEAGASLLLWDAWALGRLACGESWGFALLASTIAVRCAGTPVYVDRFRLTPSCLSLRARAGSDGYAYFASWLVFRAEACDWPVLCDRLHERLNGMVGLIGSASTLARGGCLVRLLASSAYALTEAQSALWSQSREWLLGLPPLPLRKT